MTNLFHKHLLTELHIVVCRPGDRAKLTDRLLCKAVTVNENLQSLGYTLKPEGLACLAVSPSLGGFYDHVKALVPEVKAQPMYPGFPQQVMNISEAEFRFHQMIHYFSTYGLESLFGVQVSRGWLPAYEAPVRDRADTRLLEAKVLDLVVEEEAAITALRILLGRRERLTNPELELVLEAASNCPVEKMKDLKVRFKENLDLLFPRLMKCEDREVALRALRAICAHTGDVFRCAADHLSRRKYHLVTREKKLLVKLLEQYPVVDFRGNLMQSLQNRERNLNVLKHLDYNRFSRSPEHLEAVRALRNGELLSWHAIGEKLMKEHSPKALTHLAQRPGYMIRMLNRLLSLDYSKNAILEALEPHAGAISAHLLLKVARNLSERKDDLDQKYRQKEDDMWVAYSRQIEDLAPEELRWEYQKAVDSAKFNLECQKNRIKAVYLDEPISDARELAKDTVRGLEIKLLQKKSEELKLQRDIEDCLKHQVVNGSLRQRIAKQEQKLEKLRREIASLQEKYDSKERKALAWLEDRIRIIHQESAQPMSDELIRAEEAHERELRDLEEAYEHKLKSAPSRIQELEAERERRLNMLVEMKLQEAKMRQYDHVAVEILKALIRPHFQQVITPLKGKKVFLQMDQFDLAHSVLELDDRSQDGGYIRSGIAWKIPEKARYVRFFTYWNDKQRIDIDLHAYGKDVEGRPLHVGWNADFRDGGVVHSGDITHSDAAEYIDIDLSKPIDRIYADVHFFNGRSFRDIETCFVGLMAVNKIGQDVKHYNPANCFFTHDLTQPVSSMHYGYIDVQNRYVRFVGKEKRGWREPEEIRVESGINLEEYLRSVLIGQQVQLVKSPEEADVVLTMGKSLLENAVSLVDSNFFLEC